MSQNLFDRVSRSYEREGPLQVCTNIATRRFESRYFFLFDDIMVPTHTSSPHTHTSSPHTHTHHRTREDSRFLLVTQRQLCTRKRSGESYKFEYMFELRHIVPRADGNDISAFGSRFAPSLPFQPTHAHLS